MDYTNRPPDDPVRRDAVGAAMHKLDLESLKRDGLLWQGRAQQSSAECTMPTGWAVLDEVLGGGWPRASLAEILSEAHQGLPLLIPLLARLSTEQRWLALIAPPYVPYAPALVARGVAVERLLLIRDVSTTQCLWATEQALKSGACAAVLAWPGELQTAQLRRLQLAAEQGGCLGVLFRIPRTARQGSPAALRLRVRPAPLGLEVDVLKRRAGWGGARCIVPFDSERDVTDHAR